MEAINMELNKYKIRTGEPELMRQINQALILNLLRDYGLLSRAQVSRKLKISKATVSRVVNELIESGIITVVGEGDAKETGGRRPVMLSINSSGKYVLGIDLGTTNTVIGIANLKGEIINKVRIPTNRNHSLERIVAQVTDLVEEIIKKTNIEKKYIAGLGIAEAGVVEKNSGIIKFSPNFNWENVNIASLLEKKTGLATLADNCTRTMAIGEIWHGKGRGVKNIFYVNIGYGIGSALVVNGQVYNNHSEFGHIPISNEKVRCSCGKFGCLEAVASGNAIERKANQLFKDQNNGWITAKDVAERAKIGDQTAIDIFQETGFYLGKGISFIANVFNSNKVIIGGGVSLAGDILLDPLIDSFNKYTMKAVRANTQVELSSLGMDAGVYGAITMVLNEKIFFTSLLNGAS
jgi:glucokinase-like ROK family protein